MSNPTGAFYTAPFRITDIDLFESSLKGSGLHYTNDGDDDNTVILYTEDGFAPLHTFAEASEETVTAEVDIPALIRPHLAENQTVVVIEMMIDNNMSGTFNSFSFNAGDEIYTVTDNDIIDQHKNQMGGENL